MAFFTWGLATPPLDEAWRIQADLQLTTRSPLTARERALYQGALQRYPELAEAILEGRPFAPLSDAADGRYEAGHAYLVRRGPVPKAAVRVDVGEADANAVPVQVRTTGAHGAGEVTQARPFEWDLPDSGPFPQLVEVLVPARSALPFRVQLVERR